jgi:hypothetical protein
MTEFNILALEGLLWLGVIVFVLYGPWQRICEDYTRDIIFEQRDRVFDLAANGDLQFGDAQYEKVRAHMNAMIRMAHCITAPRLVLVMMYRVQIHDSAQRDDIWECIKQIKKEETRKVVADAMHRAEITTIRLLIMRSPLLLLVFGVAKIFGKISQIRKKISDMVRVTLEKAIAYEAR